MEEETNQELCTQLRELSAEVEWNKIQIDTLRYELNKLKNEIHAPTGGTNN